MILLLVMCACCGCVSSGINAARGHYYGGRFPEARDDLASLKDTDKNYVLALMERGMIYQTEGNYPASIRDWLDAQERIRELDYVRVSEKASSLVINDRTQTYTGKPYERALLHAFTAISYFALQQWREAAVEARLIADGFENLNGFPDDPFTRYVSALAFEIIRDFSGSSIEYTKAGQLLPSLQIDPETGKINSTNTPPATISNDSNELICFVMIGRAPSENYNPQINFTWGNYPYAELFHNGTRLGRSYSFNTTANLAAATERRIAAIKAAKTVTRIVIKQSIANAVSDNNALLGEVLRLMLFALEMPDTRRWETLPLWLQVARVPCPPDIESFDVVIKNASGRTLHKTTVTSPLAHAHGKTISFIRIK